MSSSVVVVVVAVVVVAEEWEWESMVHRWGRAATMAWLPDSRCCLRFGDDRAADEMDVDWSGCGSIHEVTMWLGG